MDATRRAGRAEGDAGLRHIRRHFVNRDNLRGAIVRLVNATFAARDPELWGEGTAYASDSQKFGSWDANLMTEWHNRYRGPGVMIYWHPGRADRTSTRRLGRPVAAAAASPVERKSVCIYSA